MNSRISALLAIPLLLLAAACGGATAAEQPTGASSPVPNRAFPVTVPTKFGPVTIQQQPTRVVALGWGDAETALALGVQPVGASDWLAFGGEGVGPWAAGRYDQAPKIIGTTAPSYEAIAALKPDLILDTKSSGEQQRHDLLSKIAPTVGVPEGSDSYLTSTADQLKSVAAALGKTPEATALLEEVDTAFAQAREAHPEWRDQTFTAATKTSESWGAYIEGSDRVSFLENLGMVQNPQIAALAPNATGFSVTISSEQLKQLDADVIVAFPIFIDKSQITGDAVFQNVPAVKDGRAVIIDGDLAAAYSLGTTLALGYAVENIVPLLEKALPSDSKVRRGYPYSMTSLTALSLSPAACARTVLAAGTWLTWTADDDEYRAPYFEDGGTPVLLVERRTSALLMEARYVSTTSYVLPALGVLRVGGTPWPAVGNACLDSMRAFRLQHSECEDCCGPLRSHLVGVRIDRVEFAPNGAGIFQKIDLDAFLGAEPDPIVTHSVRVRSHLNAEHHEELRVLASRLLAVPEAEIAGATLDWIDALGVEVAVVGSEGARSFRFPFRVPLTSMDDLGGQLHRLLNQPGADSC